MTMYVTLKPECTLQHLWCCHIFQVTCAMGFNKPLHHYRCWTLNFALVTILLFFSLAQRTQCPHDFQEQFQMWPCQTIAHFPTCISPSWMSSVPMNWHFWMLLIYSFHFILWSLNMHLQMRGWTVFTGNGLLKCSRAQIGISFIQIMSVLNPVSPRGSEVIDILCWVSPLPLMCRDSLNPLIMGCK